MEEERKMTKDVHQPLFLAEGLGNLGGSSFFEGLVLQQLGVRVGVRFTLLFVGVLPKMP